jgi:hypothetical protein
MLAQALFGKESKNVISPERRTAAMYALSAGLRIQ